MGPEDTKQEVPHDLAYVFTRPLWLLCGRRAIRQGDLQKIITALPAKEENWVSSRWGKAVSFGVEVKPRGLAGPWGEEEKEESRGTPGRGLTGTVEPFSEMDETGELRDVAEQTHPSAVGTWGLRCLGHASEGA